MSAYMFQPGDNLIVHPKDDDDPEANSRKGERCEFVRYYSYAHCTVKFDGSPKPLRLRVQDLRRWEDPS